MKIHKIYYINMDKDLERRAVLEPRIERCFPGVPLERVRGLTPDELPLHDGFCKDRLSGKSKPVDGRYPYPGLVACSLSHRLGMQAIARDFPDGVANCLVLEDDCVFDETVATFIHGLSKDDLPADWRLLKHSRGRRRRSDRVSKLFHDLRRARGRNWSWYWGTHFAIYRSDRVEEILAEMEQGEFFTIDLWLRERVDGAYNFVPPLHIKQSNVGGSNTNPDFSGDEFSDRGEGFGAAAKAGGLWRQLKSRASRRKK